MTKRRWTSIYWDAAALDDGTKAMRPYVRLTPDFMDLEAAGRPHGLSIGGFRADKEDAERFADSVEAFMTQMLKEAMEAEP